MFSVIFDMDGTLLDTQQICIPAWEAAGVAQGICGIGDHIPYVCGMNEAGWTAYLLDHFPTLDEKAFKEVMHQYIIDNLVVRYKAGAEKLLAFLKENNIKIAIASGSSRATILHHLGEVDGVDLFDAIAGGAEVQNGKPAPDIFLHTAKKMGVDPADCFVFEDSANGVRAGVAAGMRVFGIPDVAPLGNEVERLLFAKLDTLDAAIPHLQPLL